VAAEFWGRFWKSIVWLLPLKIVALAVFGQFRTLLTYFSLPDAKRLMGAMGLAAAVALAVWFADGGANVVLAESLGSVGTHLYAGPTRRIVGIEINASHHKSATSGVVTGVATAVTLGKTLCTYNVEITNDKGEKTCTARITCLILAER
jgi:uncharacterized protein (TIGR00369 family)